MIDVEFIAFDLETTGLHALTHRIIEIAAVRFRGDGTVLEQFEQLIDPGCEIPAEATTVHGLRNCDVDGKPTIATGLAELDVASALEAPLAALAQRARRIFTAAGEQEKLARLHPADLADIMEELSPTERQAIVDSLDEETAAEALAELDARLQAQIVEKLDPEKAADIIEEMETALNAIVMTSQDPRAKALANDALEAYDRMRK